MPSTVGAVGELPPVFGSGLLRSSGRRGPSGVAPASVERASSVDAALEMLDGAAEVVLLMPEEAFSLQRERKKKKRTTKNAFGVSFG